MSALIKSSIINNEVLYTCNGTNDQIEINQAIEYASINGGGVVELSGDYYISSRIIIKSNVTLLLSQSSTVNLTDQACDYMIANDDFENGTVNFSIIGGLWFGNRNQQTKTYLQNPSLSFYGFGFLFKNCTNVLVKNLTIKESASWGIAHFLCTDLTIKNIKFRQWPGGNGDGITGFGVHNLIIDNISGYTGDEMIGLCATYSFMGIFGETEIIWGEGRGCKNITIRDIRLEKNTDGIPTYAGIGIYSAEGMSVDNVLVENVSGECQKSLGLVRLVNYWPTKGKGYMTNIELRNLRFKSTTINQPILKMSDHNDLEINSVIVKGVHYVNTNTFPNHIFEITGAVSHVNISDISGLTEGVGVSPVLMLIEGLVGDINLNMTNIEYTGGINKKIVNNASGLIRINAPECQVFGTPSTPEQGDRQVNWQLRPMIYLNGNWEYII